MNRRHFLKGTSLSAGALMAAARMPTLAMAKALEPVTTIPPYFLLCGVEVPWTRYERRHGRAWLELWADNVLVIPTVEMWSYDDKAPTFRWEKPWGGWIQLGGTKSIVAKSHEGGVKGILTGVNKEGNPVVVGFETVERPWPV